MGQRKMEKKMYTLKWNKMKMEKQKYKIKTRNKTKMHVPTGRTTDSQRTRTRDIKERGTHTC